MSVLTSTQVCDAIGAVLTRLWPDRYLYRDACPADHHRPSGYLYVTKSSFTPETAWLGRWEMEAQLELFCATDEYDLSSTEELRQDQERVLLAFAAPKLQVGDRWINMEAKGEGMEAGSAFVHFSANWMDGAAQMNDPNAPYDPDAPCDPDDPETPAAWRIPKMEHIEMDKEEIK